MRALRPCLVLIAIFALTACVTSLQWPENIVNRSTAMDDAQALAIAQRFLLPSDKQMGICNSTRISVHPDTLSIEDSMVSYTDAVEVMAGVTSNRVLSSGGYVSIHSRRQPVRYSFDLRQLKRIVVSEFTAENTTGSCDKGLPGRVFVLFDNVTFRGFHYTEFHVATENADALLAALKRLSPDMELIGRPAD